LAVCFSQFQGLLDSKGLKRLVTSFERKVWQLVRDANVTADHEQSLLPCRSVRTMWDISVPLQFKENLEMRTRYADQPEKFMDSELDLDEEVKKLMAIAGSPELYPAFVRTNTVQTLLTHQNTDIVADVIGVFEDLTDADVTEDSVSISGCKMLLLSGDLSA
jgi:beta-catenin-like protein 1